MIETPKISVVTISYNSSQTIEKTIKSVIEQDYENKEYIIIDGNSSDGTQCIINRYKDCIDVYLSENDNGISEAFNKGIRIASGELIVCINSDDYLLPNVLTEVAKQYDGDHDIYCGNLLLWDEESKQKRVINPSLDFPVVPFFRRPAHQGLFIHKNLYNRIGMYDEKIKYAMDLDFLMRATQQKAKFKPLNLNIAVFRLGGATNDSIFKKKNEYIYIVKKNGGNILQAYIFYLFLVVTQTLKKLLRLSGIDVVRTIRYKKYH